MKVHPALAIASATHVIKTYWKACLGGIFVLGLGLLSALANRNAGADVGQTQTEWFIPRLSETRLTSSLDEILANPIFGGDPFELNDTEETAEDIPDLDDQQNGDWRLIGIITEGLSRKAVVLEVETGELRDFAAGSTLPDGDTLTYIDANSIQIQRDNQLVEFSLFQDKRKSMTTVED